VKSKIQKRDEALTRLRSSQWKDARAKRIGTQTVEEWAESKEKRIEELEKLVDKGY
jgi:hypothetical protein